MLRLPLCMQWNQQWVRLQLLDPVSGKCRKCVVQQLDQHKCRCYVSKVCSQGISCHEHSADPFFVVQHCAVVWPQVLQSCLEKSVQPSFYGYIYNAARLLAKLHSSSMLSTIYLYVKAGNCIDQARQGVSYPCAREGESTLQLDATGPAIPVSSWHLLRVNCRSALR